MRTLRDYRKASKLRVKTIAEHMNVSTRTVHQWETGECRISAHTLMQLMELYGVDAPISQIATLIPLKQ